MTFKLFRTFVKEATILNYFEVLNISNYSINLLPRKKEYMSRETIHIKYRGKILLEILFI